MTAIASATLNTTSFDPILKQLYTIHPRVEELAYSKFPLLGLLSKNTNFEGRNGVLPVRVAYPQGIAAVFSTAQSNAKSSEYTDFLMTMTKQYATAKVDGLTIRLSRTDKGAFLRGLTAEIDGAMKALSREISKALYRTRTGVLSTVGAESTTTLTLATASKTTDIHLFELGMSLVFAETDGSTLRDSGEAAAVTGIDRDAGTLTSGANWSTVSGLTAGDSIYREGDATSAGTGNLKCAGLADWIPSSAPDSTAFYGVDRSLDPVRLSGSRYNGANDASVEEALINGQSQSATVGDGCDTMMMNNKNYRELIGALGTKVQYDTAFIGTNAGGKSAQIGFRALCIEGDYGAIKVIPDRDCPINVAYGLKLDTWKIHSAGNCPGILDDDGLRIQRVSNDDSYEVRLGAYYNLACVSPVDNVRIALA